MHQLSFIFQTVEVTGLVSMVSKLWWIETEYLMDDVQHSHKMRMLEVPIIQDRGCSVYDLSNK